MNVPTVTHTSLLARLAEGADPRAWTEFLARYGDLIRGCCFRRGLQGADAEDVQQDVLLSLSKAMPGFQYDPSRGLFRSYLKTVVMNAVSRRLLQKVSAQGLSGVSEPAGAPAGDEEAWEQEWRQYHFRRAMATIEPEFSEGDRRAFTLYALEGRSVQEAAETLGISVDSVYQAKSRIVRRLSAVIEAQIGEEG